MNERRKTLTPAARARLEQATAEAVRRALQRMREVPELRGLVRDERDESRGCG